MTAAQAFSLANLAVVPGWLMLLFLPRRRETRMLAAYVLPSVLGVAYLLIMVREYGTSGGGFGSLEQVAQLFQNPWLLLAGWLHYLAFDLFIGAWQVRDAARLSIPHAYVVPCLFLTFLAGPIGLFVYFMIRAMIVRRLPS